MARLFRRFDLLYRRQVRYLPRFSDSFPENRVIPNASHLDDVLTSQPAETFTETAQKFKNSQVDHKYFEDPESLVIRSGKVKKEKKKSESVTDKCKENIEDKRVLTTDSNGNILYLKMDNSNPKIMKIMSAVKANSKKLGLMFLEGKRLIGEALATKCELEYLLFSRLQEVEFFKEYLPKVGRLYKMPYKDLQVWSDLTTTPGVMAIFKIPDAGKFKVTNPLPLILICDNIREPNNLGAILRTACGVGCEKVILTSGCVDLWDSKVLRSACGAHFRLNISKSVKWDEVASMLPENANVFVADNNLVSLESPETDLCNLAVLPYYSIDYGNSPSVVLVIGGETEGLSLASFQLASKFNGARLNVPLSNGVNSLNSGTALGVIAFEIKRQLNQKNVN